MNQVGYGASGPGAGVRVVHTNAHSFSQPITIREIGAKSSAGGYSSCVLGLAQSRRFNRRLGWIRVEQI